MVDRERPPTRNTKPETQAETLVIGLGNPILGNDGVGWHIAHQVEAIWGDKNRSPAVDFLCVSVGGLSLMEHLEGYRRAIILDAITTGSQAIGSVHSSPLEKLADLSSGHSSSAHDTSLRTAMTVGRKMGFALPDKIWVVTIEIEPNWEFTEGLSAATSAALPEAASLALKQLERWK
jgi:hydrogenase maturation protease